MAKRQVQPTKPGNLIEKKITPRGYQIGGGVYKNHTAAYWARHGKYGKAKAAYDTSGGTNWKGVSQHLRWRYDDKTFAGTPFWKSYAESGGKASPDPRTAKPKPKPTPKKSPRHEIKEELDEAVEKRKKRLRNPRLYGRLSLLSGGERGIHSSLLGGGYGYSQSYK